MPVGHSRVEWNRDFRPDTAARINPARTAAAPRPTRTAAAETATGPRYRNTVAFQEYACSAGQCRDEHDSSLIRVHVRSVLVPTTVFDPDGHGYQNGLLPNEFELTDNGKPQKITAEFLQLPMSVVLVVQANSEVEPVLGTLKKAGVLLQGLVTGQDSDAAVISFDHRIQHLQDFTNDPAKLDDAMQKLTAGSSTARLNDAVLAADRMLRAHDPQNHRRRVIILVSRNLDKGSESKLQETAHQMQFDNVIVYAVDISRAYTALMKKPDYPRPAYGGIPPEAQGTIAGGNPRSETSNVQQNGYSNALNAVPPGVQWNPQFVPQNPGRSSV